MINIFTYKETRSIRDLLKLLRRYIRRSKSDKFVGMCGSMLDMREENLITEEEYDRLYDFIKSYKYTGGFWWMIKDKKPRIKWLRERIKELK